MTISSARQRAILGMLILGAGEVVPADRIVEGVWGEIPPADASAALQTQVSRLRAALEEDRANPRLLVTRPPGYVLAAEPDAVDAGRFAALVGQAAAELEAGTAASAEERLTEALDMWRGPALADLADAPFAATVQRDLEEQRLAAVEAHAEARLALGRPAEVARAMAMLVEDEPFRERAWELLMLALYRDGRQVDALDAYARARARFSGELGLEPGPALRSLQQRILEQDPGLLAPEEATATATADAAPPSRRAPRRSRTLLASALALGAVLLVLVVALASGGGDASSSPEPAATGTVLALDAETGDLRRRVAVGSAPGPVTIGAGATWVLDLDAQTISRLGPDRSVQTFSTGAPPLDVAAGRRWLYVGRGAPAPRTQIAGPIVAGVQRVEPTTRALRGSVALGSAKVVGRPPERQLAVVGDDVWSITASGAVVRLVGGQRRGPTVPGLDATALAAGPAGLWAVGEDGTLERIDARTARVVARTRLPASDVADLAVGADAAWVTSPSDGTVWRVPARSPANARAIPLARGAGPVAAGPSGVWVANPLSGTLTRLDPRSGRVTRVVRTGGSPRGVALSGSTLWVSLAPGPRAHGPVSSGSLAPATCEPALGARAARPDVVVVSDLPLRGGIRVSTEHMVEAVAFALRSRGYRAGRFRLAYVSCDDSVARTGVFDSARCAADALAYARDSSVLGVIGPVDSPCARAALLELARAGVEPPTYVSPLATDPALTRGPPGELRRLYPGRRRTFVRVTPPDDIESAGLALLARERGARRVFVLDDGDPEYGGKLADAFLRAAGLVGVRVVGSASWDPRRPADPRPIRALARANPDAVVLSGTLDGGGVTVLRAVHRAADRATLMLTDGFTPTNTLAATAGPAAAGAFLAVPGVTLDALTAQGRAFARDLDRAVPGAGEDPGAVLAAQAALVLVDAIGRSDGTRRSVRRALFARRAAPGLLGPVAFDRNGDLVRPPVTILRVRPGDRRRSDFEDTELDRVLHPAQSLVAP